MNIIVVDDEPLVLRGETDLIKKTLGTEDVRVIGFSSPLEALDHVYKNPVDVAILDIRMPECSGVDLARRIKLVRPEINIIFSTAYNDYYADAMQMHASGYILKPMLADSILAEINDLRHPVERKKRSSLFIRTFGDFEVFFNETPLLFRYQKTKEMLAYLIDRRGAVVESETLITVLWGGEYDRSNFFKQIRKDLKDTLESVGYDDILVRRRGSIGLLVEKISCDYFDWLRGSPEGINSYHGEYMRQYDWAQSTWVNLEGKSNLWEE